jgi:hypothetical protein
MAQEVIINVQASTAEANKNLEKLNATILEQKEILVELERELYKVESAQKETSKTSLSAQKALRDEAQHLTSSIQDQRLSLKELNVQQQNTKAALDSVNTSSQQVAGSFEDVTANGGAMAILDTLTGGLATRMRDAFEATKLFNVSLKATKTALIATGIGAFVVGLGLVVAYWDEISEAITGANKKLQENIDLNVELTSSLSLEESLIREQIKLLERKGNLTEQEKESLLSNLDSQKKLNQEALASLEKQQQLLKGNKSIEIELGAAKNLLAQAEEKNNTKEIERLGKVVAKKEAILLADKAASKEFRDISDEITKRKTQQLNLEQKILDITDPSKEDLSKLEEQKKKWAEENKKRIEDDAKAEQELVDLKKQIRDAEANTIPEQRIKELEDLQLHYDALILKAQEQNLATEELEKSKNESLLQLQADFNQQDLDAVKQKEDAIQKILDESKIKQDEKDLETQLLEAELAETNKLAELEKLGATLEQKQAIRDYYAGFKIEAEKADAAKTKAIDDKALADKIANIQAEQSVREANAATIADGLNGLQNVFKAFGKENKALAIASIIVDQVSSISRIISNTGIANAKAVAASPLTFGQPWVAINSISAGASIAGSAAGAAKAISALKSDKPTPTTSSSIPSYGGGGSAPTITAASAPPSFNVVGASDSSQLAGVIANQSQQPIQAYVVSNDVTTAQSLDRNIIESVGI